MDLEQREAARGSHAVAKQLSTLKIGSGYILLRLRI
jgi:hypothetical protein